MKTYPLLGTAVNTYPQRRPQRRDFVHTEHSGERRARQGTEGELELRGACPLPCRCRWRAAFRPGVSDSQVPSLVENEIGVTRLTDLVAQQGHAQGQQHFPVGVTGAAVG